VFEDLFQQAIFLGRAIGSKAILGQSLIPAGNLQADENGQSLSNI